jgi:hypothetical protein
MMGGVNVNQDGFSITKKIIVILMLETEIGHQ